MTPAASTQPMTTRLAARDLTAAAALLAGLWAVVAMLCWSPSQRPWSALLSAVAVAWLAAILSFLPVRLAQRSHAPMALFRGAMLAMAIRMILSLAAILIAVRSLSMPPVPFCLALVTAYLALLPLEVRWTLAPGSHRHASPPATGPQISNHSPEASK